jgi:hypothetical protein
MPFTCSSASLCLWLEPSCERGFGRVLCYVYVCGVLQFKCQGSAAALCSRAQREIERERERAQGFSAASCARVRRELQLANNTQRTGQAKCRCHTPALANSDIIVPLLPMSECAQSIWIRARGIKGHIIHSTCQ